MKAWSQWAWDTVYLIALCSIVLITSSTGYAKPLDDQVNNALMSWAVLLSGYAVPQKLPDMIQVKHSYLETNACGGKSCNVLGLYDGQNTVYLDDRMKLDSVAEKSIVVHEFVHFLQKKSGVFGASCQDAIAQEREAYAVQQEFLTRHGIYYLVGTALHFSSCDKIYLKE